MANDNGTIQNTDDTTPVSGACMDISSLLHPPSPEPPSVLAPLCARIPVMNRDDFRARYKANDFFLAQAARLQNSAIKASLL